MKILKWIHMSNLNNQYTGKGFQNYFAHNLLNDLDLKTLSSIRTMTILQGPRSRVKQNLWTALSRSCQASSLHVHASIACPLIIFSNIILHRTHTTCIQNAFQINWWMVESWYVVRSEYGTMEIPLYREWIGN